MDEALDAHEVVERLCKLVARVNEEVFEFGAASDCFCGEGGFNCVLSDYGPTYEQGYRFDSKVLDYIEKVVTESLTKEKKNGE